MVDTPATSGSLRWAVRDSLLRYVTVIAGGTYEMGDGVVVDDSGVFSFPLERIVSEGEDRRLSFAGWVHFTAHHGLLDIRIIDPEVIIGPDGGVLVARTRADDPTITPIVVADPVEPSGEGGSLVWNAVPTRLLDDGVPLFGDVYPAGTDMAPFEMSVALDS